MLPINVLVMDRDEAYIAEVVSALEGAGMRAEGALFWPDALRVMAAQLFDVVLLDVKMTADDRVEMLRTVKLKYPLVEIIMSAGAESMEEAVEGLKLGAFDFIVKPFDERDAVAKISMAADRKRKAEEKIKNARIKRIISHPMAVFEKDEELENE